VRPYAEVVTKLRIALAQVNATVGDLDGNAELIVAWTRRAAQRGARVVVFPEMMLTGYPVEDLALRASFVEASIATLHAVAARLGAEGLGGIAVVTGYLDRRADLEARTGLPAGAPQDAAALLYGGRVVITSAKHHLPNYGVFDEFRYFVPGDTLPVFRVPAADGQSVEVAIAICEDLWQDGGPVAVCRRAGAGLLVVPNASPYERGKDDVRLDLVIRRAREAGAALAYANMIGGQDELVFDGDSILVAADGTVLARGPQFEEELVVADLDLPAAPAAEVPGEQPVDAEDGTVITIRRVALPDVGSPPEAAAGDPGQAFWPRLPDAAEVYAALVTGVRDYVRKNAFGSVIVALSGGIDSALTATIAADAIGPDNVHVVLMPSRYSSEHSVIDAEDLVKRQGVHAVTIPIPSMVDAFQEELSPAGFPDTGRPAENLQARVRGVVLMGLSNAGGHLALTTGNKSELATGYSTLYGDSAGGFGPIKDVPKTLVWELARWRNAEASRLGATPPIPENSITKPPSAELAPGQLDTDSLPPYEVLDALLDDYVEKDMGSAELIAAGHDPAMVERVIRLVDAAEFKRRQYPPGPKISQKNFGRDRRLPITNRWREHCGPSALGAARFSMIAKAFAPEKGIQSFAIMKSAARRRRRGTVQGRVKDASGVVRAAGRVGHARVDRPSSSPSTRRVAKSSSSVAPGVFSRAMMTPVRVSMAISTSVSGRSSPVSTPRRMTVRMTSRRGSTTVSLYLAISRGYLSPSPRSNAYRRALRGSALSAHITLTMASRSSRTLTPSGSGNGDFSEPNAASSSSSLFGQRR
jgi:NAD+ synthase (glutamine-hydrolysing)